MWTKFKDLYTEAALPQTESWMAGALKTEILTLKEIVAKLTEMPSCFKNLAKNWRMFAY